MAQTLDSKLENLKERLKSMNSAVIAFSGGVDSTFLAKVAFDVLGKRAIAVTAASSTHPKRELAEARKHAKSIGISHVVINTEETERPGFKENTPMRCYFCKKELFSKIRALADHETAMRPRPKGRGLLGSVSSFSEMPPAFPAFQKCRKSAKQISETPTGNSDLKDGVSTVVDEEIISEIFKPNYLLRFY